MNDGTYVILSKEYAKFFKLFFLTAKCDAETIGLSPK